MRSSRQSRILGSALLLCALLSLPVALPAGAAPGGTAPQSRLAFPTGADVWVDAEGTPTATAPGTGVIKRLAILVYRPLGDSLSWEALTALYTGGALLAENPRVEFNLRSAPTPQGAVADPDANAEEVNVYTTRTPDTLLALGFIRNLVSRRQLAYAVLLTGTLTPEQGAGQARRIANELALQAKLRRLGPPRPVGSVAASPERQLRGAQIQQLLRSIQNSNLVSPRVKAMAGAVLPRATAVTLTTWHTPAAVTDQAFFTFYLEQARRLGWGSPISRDETQSGRPALLFQRPNNEGVAMIRAQPTPIGGRGGSTRPTTTIYILMIDGAFAAEATPEP